MTVISKLRTYLVIKLLLFFHSCGCVCVCVCVGVCVCVCVCVCVGQEGGGGIYICAYVQSEVLQHAEINPVVKSFHS